MSSANIVLDGILATVKMRLLGFSSLYLYRVDVNKPDLQLEQFAGLALVT